MIRQHGPKNVNMFNLFSQSFFVDLNNLLPAVFCPPLHTMPYEVLQIQSHTLITMLLYYYYIK